MVNKFFSPRISTNTKKMVAKMCLLDIIQLVFLKSG